MQDRSDTPRDHALRLSLLVRQVKQAIARKAFWPHLLRHVVVQGLFTEQGHYPLSLHVCCQPVTGPHAPGKRECFISLVLFNNVPPSFLCPDGLDEENRTMIHVLLAWLSSLLWWCGFLNMDPKLAQAEQGFSDVVQIRSAIPDAKALGRRSVEGRAFVL